MAYLNWPKGLTPFSASPKTRNLQSIPSNVRQFSATHNCKSSQFLAKKQKQPPLTKKNPASYPTQTQTSKIPTSSNQKRKKKLNPGIHKRNEALSLKIGKNEKEEKRKKERKKKRKRER